MNMCIYIKNKNKRFCLLFSYGQDIEFDLKGWGWWGFGLLISSGESKIL